MDIKLKKRQLALNTSNIKLINAFSKVKFEVESATGLELSNANILRFLVTNFLENNIREETSKLDTIH
tara:strand:+ start:356 stop:559 length:204 start_codon:yes stop_codon:yes gene_type:complete